MLIRFEMGFFICLALSVAVQDHDEQNPSIEVKDVKYRDGRDNNYVTLMSPAGTHYAGLTT